MSTRPFLLPALCAVAALAAGCDVETSRTVRLERTSQDGAGKGVLKVVDALLRARAQSAWRRQRFYRMLDAMLFRAADPDRRYRIFERFYRLSPRLVARFYAGRSTAADRLRLLAGKPPVPVGRALSALAKLDWK